MERGVFEFLIHEDILSIMRNGGERAAAISKILALAQDGSGLVFLNDTKEYSFLLESNYLLPVNRIIDYEGKSFCIKNLFILNCDYIWNGKGWMRGVYTYNDGVVTYNHPWIPVIDTIEAAKRMNFIL